MFHTKTGLDRNTNFVIMFQVPALLFEGQILCVLCGTSLLASLDSICFTVYTDSSDLSASCCPFLLKQWLFLSTLCFRRTRTRCPKTLKTKYLEIWKLIVYEIHLAWRTLPHILLHNNSLIKFVKLAARDRKTCTLNPHVLIGFLWEFHECSLYSFAKKLDHLPDQGYLSLLYICFSMFSSNYSNRSKISI